MIIYDSKIARLLQGRMNPYDYVTLPIVTLTTLPYGEIGIWEEMEMRIHRRQYTECFLAALLPSLLLGWQVCWELAALPLFAYYILYWAERLAVGHSAFDYEAGKESEEVSYFVVRRRFAWWKWFWKKKLPAIDRSWFC
ncbi:hypothetical protein [Parabacteroides sp. D26]|jgi:hypothetical protein|uniref:hypothetical protein n=1 Tax=Parabacteroides sp. D26 TaxID=658662 RepID=UPI003565992F